MVEERRLGVILAASCDNSEDNAARSFVCTSSETSRFAAPHRGIHRLRIEMHYSTYAHLWKCVWERNSAKYEIYASDVRSSILFRKISILRWDYLWPSCFALMKIIKNKNEMRTTRAYGRLFRLYLTVGRFFRFCFIFGWFWLLVIQIDGCRNRVVGKQQHQQRKNRVTNCIICNPHFELSFFRLVFHLIYNLRVHFTIFSPPRPRPHLSCRAKCDWRVFVGVGMLAASNERIT